MRKGKTVAERLTEFGITTADTDEAIHDLLDHVARQHELIIAIRKAINCPDGESLLLAVQKMVKGGFLV